jgi:hypothetical protein
LQNEFKSGGVVAAMPIAVVLVELPLVGGHSLVVFTAVDAGTWVVEAVVFSWLAVLDEQLVHNAGHRARTLAPIIWLSHMKGL